MLGAGATAATRLTAPPRENGVTRLTDDNPGRLLDLNALSGRYLLVTLTLAVVVTLSVGWAGWVLDRATTDHPHDVSQGIETVWVNGQIVLHDRLATSRRPGSIVRRPQ